MCGPSLERLLASRRSVRGFRPEPVPEPLIRAVVGAAQRAPSNCNIQPWLAHIVSGAAAQRIRLALLAAVDSGQRPDPDVPMSYDAYEGVHRARQIAAAKALFAATGIARGDARARAASMRRNYGFFEAPHAVFIFMPKGLGSREVLDVGIYVQTLMLLLAAHGIACCAQGALSHYAGVVHRELEVPNSQLLLVGIAFGYEDPEHTANAARTDRVPLSDAVLFHTR